MYSDPIRIESANAEVMSESYCTAQEGDMEVIWVTFDDGLTVSVARSSRKPTEMKVRTMTWNDPGAVTENTVVAAKPMTRELP